MAEIRIEHRPSPAKLEVMGVFEWAICQKEISMFSLSYDKTEVCYILEGEGVVTPEKGAPVTCKRGDWVYFAAGLACEWQIRQSIKKHYTFE
jgi:uncharacterized protein